MKQGCLFLIALIGAASFGYWKLIEGTLIEDQYWLPPVLGILAAIAASNLYGIILAIRHIRASGRPQIEWKDGDLVVVSGRIQTKGSMKAPISGRAAAIVEYEICRYDTRRSNGKTQTVKDTDYRGCLMTPCFIQTISGSIHIVGFPLLMQWSTETLEESQHYQNIADFIVSNPSTVLPKSPMAVINELKKVLKDDDGTVNANYRMDDAQDLLSLDDSDLEDAEPQEDSVTQEGLNQKIINFLKYRNYTLEETLIENGQEVTAMGSYLASKRQVNIGSGLSKLSHAIYKGNASKVLGSNLRKAIILSLIFVGIFTAANYFLLKKLGMNPDYYIDNWKQVTIQ